MRELEYTVLYTIYEGIAIYCIEYYICGNWNILYCILYMRELEYTVLYTIYEGIGIYSIVYYM